MKRMTTAAFLVLLGLLFVPGAWAQNHGEVGAYVDYFRFSDLNNTNFLGIGGRLSVNVHPHVQLEAQMAYDFEKTFGEVFENGTNGTFNTNRTPLRILHGLFGPKFQTGGGALRAFFTVKGGFVNFRFDPRPATFSTFTSSVEGLRGNNVDGEFYPGGGLEAYLGPIGLRLDVGDEIFFQNGAHNNLSVTFGPNIRF